MDRAEHELLRVEVRRMKTLSGRRRSAAPALNVGDLAGARLVVPLAALGPDDDLALATDALTRAFDRLMLGTGPGAGPATGPHAGPGVWLTRAGDLVPGDADWRWRAATSAVRRGHGWEPGSFHVVTRHGWLALPSGERRVWTRMRATWTPPFVDERADEWADEHEQPHGVPVAPHPVEGWPIRY